MKILMVSEDLPGAQVGGLGKHVVTLSNALLTAGHEVAILGRNGAGTDGGARQVGFRGRFIGGFDFAHPGWKELQLGVFNPLKRPSFARKIARAIGAHAAGFEVVHYHGHLPMVALHVDRSLNFVQTRHDQGSECVTNLRFRDGVVCSAASARACAGCIHPAPGPLRQRVSALAVTRYRSDAAEAFRRHKTIFVSDFLRRQFLRQMPGADLERSRVIHNFVDYAMLSACVQAPRAGQVLVAGRIDTGKGFGEFLAAVRGRLPPSARLLIVGDGPERAALENRHAGRQVRFLGWRPYREVLALTARSHVCVVPSLWEEPCGTTVLEALGLGRPCVALARGGTPELADYQFHDGQLQLAGSMDRLASMLCAQLELPPAACPLPASAALDVSHAIPKILACYAE